MSTERPEVRLCELQGYSKLLNFSQFSGYIFGDFFCGEGGRLIYPPVRLRHACIPIKREMIT